VAGRPVWWGGLRVNSDGWSSEFSSVDLLLKHLGRKSRSVASRKNYCYNLRRLCSGIRVSPDELILRARQNPDDVAALIQTFADKYNSIGSTRTANHIIHLTRTFFKVNKVELDLRSYYQPARSRRRPEYIPSLQEALRMASVAGSLRDRLIIWFLIYTGLRNSTVRALVFDESYPDPLFQEHTIKKQLEKGEECLTIVVHEVMKKRIPDACKNRVFYYTFIPPKVTECLRLHLQEMEEKYGPILDDQPIFHTSDRRIPLRERLKTHISERELQHIVKKVAKRAGIKNWKYVHPHSLRKTYESFLRNQPDDVRLDNKEREFLFGHILPGSQDTYFDKTKIEELRAKYSKMIFEPVAGVEKEERVICEDELPAFLEQGWHFEAILPSENVVVSRKTIAHAQKQPEAHKTANSPQVSSDANVQKEKPQEDLKSLDQNQASSISHSDSISRPTPQNNIHKQTRAPKNRSAQPDLPIWTKPLEAELSMNIETKVESSSSLRSKIANNDKKKNSMFASHNVACKTKQKSLFDFVA
jgi:integrase